MVRFSVRGTVRVELRSRDRIRFWVRDRKWVRVRVKIRYGSG